MRSFDGIMKLHAPVLKARREEIILQRASTCPVEHWSDKVMSVLREQQLEACQERLSRCPELGLFDDIQPEVLSQIFPGSYLAWEQGKKRAFDLEDIRRRVLSSVEEECAFLSIREDNLVKRMIIAGGETPLDDWEDISAAEALIKRLWCVIRIDPETDTAALCLQPPVMEACILGMSEPRYPRIRQALFRFDATLHALLYLSGFLHAYVPVRHFQEQLEKEELPSDRMYVSRYLKSAFDYYTSAQGEMLLVHPGLYDPEGLIAHLKNMGVPEMQLTHTMVLGGMNGLLPEEVASAQSMRGALQGAVRPELDEEEVLEDLRMMAKQGASFTEMKEVLESCLCVLPAPGMLSALRQVHVQTVRWIGMAPAVLN